MEALVPVSADSMTSYLQQISRFDLLSREEEYELAMRYRKRGDLDAARRLICSNLLFVVKVAREYRHTGLPTLDLVQEGNLGLMVALKKFDPELGNRFISYAVWWIRAYIQNYIMQAWSLVKIGTTQAQKKLFYRLKKTREALKSLTGEEDSSEIAEQLGVKEQEVIEMSQRLSARDQSLDLELEEGEPRTPLDLLPDTRPNQEGLIADRQQRQHVSRSIASAMKQLNDRERVIVERRYLSESPQTLQALADTWGISRERVRQIEQGAIRKMRQKLLPLKEGLL